MKILVIKKDNINIEKELKILRENDFEIVEKAPDYIFSFGGDGTILRALKYAIKYDKPIVAINYGRLGYMADTSSKDLDLVIESIKEKKYILSKRYLLECNLDNRVIYALNDIVFKNDFLDEIGLYDNDTMITCYRADGLVISTPTGSTAYALSAGGSIIHPELKVLNIVAIASQYLSTRSLILPNRKLKVISNSNIYIDGMMFEKASKVFVNLSEKYIHILELTNKNYYNVLKSKLEWR